MRASERGIGVAVITSRCAVAAASTAPSPSPVRSGWRSAERCITPKRCCSSTTARPSRWKSTPCWISACVPTIRFAPPWRIASRASRRSFARVEPVSSTTRSGSDRKGRLTTPLSGGSGSPESTPQIVRKCCSASTSVGAISTAWWPSATAPIIAARATTVLPEPTSPCSSRAIGCGRPRSSSIASRAARCAPVSSNGSVPRNASIAAWPAKAGASPCERHSRLRRTTPIWIASSSSKAMRRRALSSAALLSG